MDFDTLLYLCEEYADLGNCITKGLRGIAEGDWRYLQEMDNRAVPFLFDFLAQCVQCGDSTITKEAKDTIEKISKFSGQTI